MQVTAFSQPSRCSPSSPLCAQEPAAPPDATLYTNYSIYPGSGSGPIVDWVVCGSTQETEGCYASGNLGPFVGIGAMLEGNPSVSGNVVTRSIYVVDSGSADNVLLYVYKKVDTVTTGGDAVTVTLSQTVSLPLTGGSDSTTSMAANNNYLFIGTNQSPQAIRVKKSNLAVARLGEFSPPINTISITSNRYGYVAVTQGDSTGETGFSLYGANGEEQEDGGGADFVLGTTQAVSPTPLIANPNPPPAPKLGWRLKTAK